MAKKPKNSAEIQAGKNNRNADRAAAAERYGFSVSVRFSQAELVKLKAVADKDKRSMAFVIRAALEKHLA